MSRGFTTDMLSQGLAIVVGVGSISLYLAAFFFPEVHRRHDFFWSGVGCLYALILWTDASQITPTEFVGHLASVSLLGWMGWQTLTMRRRRTPKVLQTLYTDDSWPTFRREMTDLAQGFLRQSPLGRWLPGETPETTSPTTGLRVSSLKDVGYEFLDDVDPADPEVKRGSGVLRSPVSPLAPPPVVLSPPVSRPKASKAPKASAQPPRSVGQSRPGLLAWLQDRVGAIGKPKPKRAVIDIPPRPPSIPLTKATKGTTPTQPDGVDSATKGDRRPQPAPPRPTTEADFPTAGTIAIQDVTAQPLEPTPEPAAEETSVASPSTEPVASPDPEHIEQPSLEPSRDAGDPIVASPSVEPVASPARSNPDNLTPDLADTNWPEEENFDGGQNLAATHWSQGNDGAGDNPDDESADDDEDWI